MRSKVILLASLSLVFLWAAGFGGKYRPFWKVYKNSDLHFSFESPYPLVKTSPTVKTGYLFLGNPKTGEEYKHFKILLSVVPTEINSTVTIKNVSATFAKWMDDDKTMTDLKTRDLSWNCSGIPAVVTVGTCKDVKGVTRRFKMLNVIGPPNWWAIILQYDPDDQAQDKIADRIISSFNITN